jgi:hypothetical protein
LLSWETQTKDVLRAPPGHWVERQPDGSLSVCAPELFDLRYRRKDAEQQAPVPTVTGGDRRTVKSEVEGVVGCTDHGCVFGHPGSLGTNGCCCLDDLLPKDRRQVSENIRLLRAEMRRLQSAPEWKPISTVPLDGSWVELWWPALAADKTSDHIRTALRVVTLRWERKYEEWCNPRGTLYAVTPGPSHWRWPHLDGPAQEIKTP